MYPTIDVTPTKSVDYNSTRSKAALLICMAYTWFVVGVTISYYDNVMDVLLRNSPIKNIWLNFLNSMGGEQATNRDPLSILILPAIIIFGAGIHILALTDRYKKINKYVIGLLVLLFLGVYFLYNPDDTGKWISTKLLAIYGLGYFIFTYVAIYYVTKIMFKLSMHKWTRRILFSLLMGLSSAVLITFIVILTISYRSQ